MTKLSFILFLMGFTMSLSQITAAVDPAVCAALVKAKAPQPAGTSVEQDINSFCRNEAKYPKRCIDQIWQIVLKSQQSIPDYGYQTDQCQVRADHRVINLNTNTLIAPNGSENLSSFVDRLKKERRCEFVPVRCEIKTLATSSTYEVDSNFKPSGCTSYNTYEFIVNGKKYAAAHSTFLCYYGDYASESKYGVSDAFSSMENQFNDLVKKGVCY